MSDNGNFHETPPGARCSPRVYSVREIMISYEGRDEEIVVKPPNLSRRGMFVNTSRPFPEGAVLNLRFNLVLTEEEIRTRGEVRYCLPGVGIGVEFIGLAPEAVKMIEREISLNGGRVTRPGASRHLKKTVARSRAKRVR
jgi:PilZ domain